MKKILTTILAAILAMAAAVSAYSAPVEKPRSHFAWGAEAGGSIDLTSNDMSTINIDALFGYRNSWLDVAGVGAGIHVMVNNSSRTFPIYTVFRTSFCSRPSLCFMDLRLGAVINNVNDETTHTRFYMAPGVGFNLARSKNFASYVTLSYEFNGMRSYVKDGERFNINNLSMAMIKIGVTF